MVKLFLVLAVLGLGYQFYFKPEHVDTETCPACTGSGTLWTGWPVAIGRPCDYCKGSKKVPLNKKKRLDEELKDHIGKDLFGYPGKIPVPTAAAPQ